MELFWGSLQDFLLYGFPEENICVLCVLDVLLCLLFFQIKILIKLIRLEKLTHSILAILFSVAKYTLYLVRLFIMQKWMAWLNKVSRLCEAIWSLVVHWMVVHFCPWCFGAFTSFFNHLYIVIGNSHNKTPFLSNIGPPYSIYSQILTRFHHRGQASYATKYSNIFSYQSLIWIFRINIYM